MRVLCLLGMCVSILFAACSSTGDSKGCLEGDVGVEDTAQADGAGDALPMDTAQQDTKPPQDLVQEDTFEVAKPECTLDSDCDTIVDAACLVGKCDEGNCVVVEVADGTACDDGNGCTQTDACQAGECKGSNPVVCPQPDPCHDTGVCDPATGQCSNPEEADGTVCDDGNEATGGDTCQGGLCLGEGCVCNNFSLCCDGCFALNEGGPCDNGDECTQADSCVEGFCVGFEPVVCELMDQCHEVGTCDPASGICSNPAKSDTTECDDGDERTVSDQCMDGVCVGTPCTCDTVDTCCDGCMGINQGGKCWEGTQYGGICTAEGVCHDPSRWAVVALNEFGIATIDTLNDVMYGPFLDGWLGSHGGGRFDVVVSPDGLTAVVSNFGDSTLFFVDLTDPTDPLPLGSLLMPMFAEDLAFTHDGKYILMTDGGFSKYIVVVDAASRTIVEAYSHPGVFSNAVSTAPDGTVLVADYFAGQIHALTIDAQGHLSFVASHSPMVSIEGKVELGQGDRMFRPVNVFISPDGKTVIAPDVQKYNETPTTMHPLIDAGPGFFALAVFEIVSPGVLAFKGGVSKVPAAAQSMAFSDDGKHAYILGNNMTYKKTVDDDVVYVDDHLLVLDIADNGEVTLNTALAASLKRQTSSQLFGVDNIVYLKGKVYATHSTVSGATKNVTVVDLKTFKVSRLPAGDITIGIAVVPMNAYDAPALTGPATCKGICGAMNQAAGCACDEACQDWNDCCGDVELFCQGCDPEECEGKDRERVCEMLPNGTYGCGCVQGYTYSGPGGCADIDECALGINNCIEGTQCANTDGSYTCICPNPMMWDGFGACVCPMGFVADPVEGCVDIDECGDGNGPCSDSATCVNSAGGFDCECDWPLVTDGLGGCECQEGTVLDDTGSCVDIDECAVGNGPCKEGATCVNEDGYYQCTCEMPFVSDNFDGCKCPWGTTPDEVEGCVDIDECASEPCGEGALCVNEAGYFMCICEWPLEWDGALGCQCAWGYASDGAGSCEEIDECASQPCHGGATCIDKLGEFECACEYPLVPDWMNGCQCDWGYESDGDGGCTEVNECETEPCPAEASCIDQFGYRECECPSPMYFNGWECVCGSGYESDGEGGCVEINECETDPCPGLAECVDQVGYRDCYCDWPKEWKWDTGDCGCAGGFRVDGANCTDIDECAEGTHNCWEGETCVNEPGYYWCNY